MDKKRFNTCIVVILSSVLFGFNGRAVDQAVVDQASAPVVVPIMADVPFDVYQSAKTHGIENWEKLPQKIKDYAQKNEWLGRPWASLGLAAVLVAGGILCMKMLGDPLKKDKRARELKLKRDQQAMGGVNPMLQMLQMLERQQNGEEEETGPMKREAVLPEDQEAPGTKGSKEESINERHVMKRGTRTVFRILLFLSKLATVGAVINVVDKAADCWKGNSLPWKLRKIINHYNVGYKLHCDGVDGYLHNPAEAPVAQQFKAFKNLCNLEKHDKMRTITPTNRECYILEKTLLNKQAKARLKVFKTIAESPYKRLTANVFGLDLDPQPKQ